MNDGMRVGHFRGDLTKRLRALVGLAHVALVVIATAYGMVQIVDGEVYRELADNNRLRKLSLSATRGLVTDRHGRILIENVPGYGLLLDRSLTEDLDASLAHVAKILGEPVETLRERYDKARRIPFKPVRIVEQMNLSEVARFSVEHLEHPELEIAVEPLRLYRHAHQTAHLLGYLGEVTDKELDTSDSPYRLGDEIGKKGIEALYEDHLRGERGEQVVVVDSRGRLVEELDRVVADPGRDLRLTIDLEIQQEAARLLDGKVGAIVALDPRQGEILAMVSSPAFDPNLFARGLRTEDWRKLTEDPHRPLQNRAIQNTYPPGSIFKIVMALAGLDRGLIDPQTTTVYCNGSAQIYGHRRRCWKASGHGRVDLAAALRDSCDIFFYELGKKLDIDTIAEYSHRLGLGAPTGIDLQGEKRGLVPTRQWSRERRGTPWYPGETISVAIGQGPILMTPLQVADLFAAVAVGYRVRPHLVPPQPGVDIDAPAPEPLTFKREHLDIVRRALVEVVNSPVGTGKNARVDDLILAGKTGTAQVVTQETWTKNDELPPEFRDHAWFASYAPAEDPRLVVVAFVEHGGGSTAAAPLAKAIYEIWLRSRSASTSAEPPPAEPTPTVVLGALR